MSIKRLCPDPSGGSGPCPAEYGGAAEVAPFPSSFWLVPHRPTLPRRRRRPQLVPIHREAVARPSHPRQSSSFLERRPPVTFLRPA